MSDLEKKIDQLPERRKKAVIDRSKTLIDRQAVRDFKARFLNKRLARTILKHRQTAR